MPKFIKVVLVLLGLYLLANFLYAAKSLAGVDVDGKGNHGNLFPIGDWIYQHFGGKHGE